VADWPTFLSNPGDEKLSARIRARTGRPAASDAWTHDWEERHGYSPRSAVENPKQRKVWGK
jgi:hypothetical protein